MLDEAFIETVRQARASAELAYEFAPNSYTYSSFIACGKAWRAVAEMIEAEKAAKAEAAFEESGGARA